MMMAMAKARVKAIIMPTTKMIMAKAITIIKATAITIDRMCFFFFFAPCSY